MRKLILGALLACGACVTEPQTYRDLDQIGREYQRESEAGTLPAAQPQNADEATAADSCGASRYRQLMGTPAADIDRAALPANTRVIMPGQMVTMDFLAQRLNIRVAPDGNVASLGCF